MRAASTLRSVRARSGLSLRQLARRAGTSHSALAAYEAGRKVPTVDTLERIAHAAGFDLEVRLSVRLAESRAIGEPDAGARGRELVEVLDLAGQFPARQQPSLPFPVFGRP